MSKETDIVTAIDDSKRVMVCNKCFRASCWYGEFICDEARGAGTIVLTAGELRKLKRENQEYWTDAYFLKVYGATQPDFQHA